MRYHHEHLVSVIHLTIDILKHWIYICICMLSTLTPDNSMDQWDPSALTPDNSMDQWDPSALTPDNSMNQWDQQAVRVRPDIFNIIVKHNYTVVSLLLTIRL